MAQTANTVFRDFTTDGVPSSGAHNPKKADIREWGAYVEQLHAAAQAGGGVVFQTKAAMTPGYAANQIAWVISDPTAANNGIYQKQGASGVGSWLRVGDLPYSFIRASNVDAGTANAIKATTSIPVPQADGAALITVNVTVENTGPVTVSFNDGAPLSVVAPDRTPLQSGDLTINMLAAGYKVGSEFRLITDPSSLRNKQAAQAAQDGAEAAQAGAESAKAGAEAARDIAAGYASDAVSQGNVPIYATAVGVAELNIPPGINAIRVNGRDVAGDGKGGLYVSNSNGSTDTIPSGDGRTWYRAADVGVKRGTAAMKAGLRPDFLNRHRLRFEQFIPAGFPDGPSIIAAKGLDRLYQQGVVFDEQSGQVFRIFNSNTGTDNTWAWIAVYNRNPTTGAMTYISCFSAGGRYNEGAIIHRIGGVRYLDIFMGTGTNQIGRYDITTLPANQTRMSTSAVFNSIPAKVQMAGYGGVFLLEDNSRPFGSFRRKYIHQRYDNGWNAKGPVVFGIETTGDDGDEFPAITELYAKSQGCSMSADFIVHHVGGYYDSVAGDKAYSNQGIRVCDTSGELLASVTLPGSKLAALITAQGYTADRVETEGGYITADGRIFSYVMFKSGSSANQTVTGCAVVEWMASSDEAIGFSADASQATSSPVVNGRLLNDVDPSTGSKFTLSTLLDFMTGRDIPSVSFAAARYPAIVDLNGVVFPSFAVVRIDMLDNFSWRIRAKNLTTEKEYQISGSPRAQTMRTVRDEGTWTPSLKINGVTTGITYSVQTGTWKIANGVATVDFRIELSSKGAQVGTVTLDPMPITPANTSGTGVVVTQNMASLTGPVFCNAQVAGAMALYHSNATGRALLADTNLTNTSILRGTATFVV